MKRVISLLLVVMMIFTITACQKEDTKTPGTETPNTGNETKSEEPYRAALLLNGTLGDKSFFDSAYNGLKELRDEVGKDVFDFKEVQMGSLPADQTKWESTLLDACDEGIYDVIIVGTFQMYEYLEKAAREFPEQKFMFFDEAFTGLESGDYPNVYNLLYKQNEVSFLVGAIAAMMINDESLPMIDTSSKSIGFLGGMENPVVNDFLVGYIQGAKHIDPDVKVAISYVGNFTDSAKGKDLALTQYKNAGVNVGYNVAGSAGLGQIEAAVEANKYAVGVDSDQAALLPEKADFIPTSALKNVGNTLKDAIKKDIDGNLKYGTADAFGFAEGGVELVKDAHYKEILPEEIVNKIEELQEDIISGRIVVDSALGKSTEEINAIKESVK